VFKVLSHKETPRTNDEAYCRIAAHHYVLMKEAVNRWIAWEWAKDHWPEILFNMGKDENHIRSLR
jgi:hypothetical protein